MRTHSKIKKGLILLIVSSILSTGYNSIAQTHNRNKKCIKLALLLDTSNSMDGLIDQAKSQLWTIVNEMAKAKCDNVKTELKIALYEYGNDNLPSSEGFIRMVTPLTTDLDQLSQDLFDLKTNGGQEYCGYVINTTLKELDWNANNGDYQVIFIAGNEEFTQGNINYISACEKAKNNGVIVNTIFCGDFNEGINTMWKKGADLTNGNYFSIEQNKKTVYIESPYDDEILSLNNKLNDTYIYYGAKGEEKKEMQTRQDANAYSYGKANYVKRAFSKSSHVYRNSYWDLVDASDETDFDISDIDNNSLPKNLQNKSEDEIMTYINKKKLERHTIKKEINELKIKREEYIKNQRKENSNEDMLDNAILSCISKQAKTNGIIFE